MTIYLPWLICLIGLLLYLAPTNGKVARIGEIMFGVGMLAGLLVSGTLRIG